MKLEADVEVGTPNYVVEAIIKLPYHVHDKLLNTYRASKYKQWIRLRHAGWEYVGRPLPAGLDYIYVSCTFRRPCDSSEMTIEFMDKMVTLNRVELDKKLKGAIVNVPVGPNFVGPQDCTVAWCEPALVGMIASSTIIECKLLACPRPNDGALVGTLERAYADLVCALQTGNRRISLCAASGSGKSWIAERAANYANCKFTIWHAQDIHSFPLHQEESVDCVAYFEDADEQCPSLELNPGKLEKLVLFWQRLEAILGDTKRRVILGFRELHSVDKYYMSEWQKSVIHIQFPNYDERLYILQHLLSDQSPKLDTIRIAGMTSGYMFDDLCRLIVHMKSENNCNDDLQTQINTFSTTVQSRFKMDIDRTVTWDTLGGLRKVRQQVKELIEDPFRYKQEFAKYGIRSPRGILMHGPPGCSKTSIAKAIANSMYLPFYSLDTAAIFSSFVGESERLVRELFQAARLTAPSIIFLDEIEVIVGKRGGGDGNPKDALQERLLATFLTEMDGVDTTQDQYVLVIGATNRADNIDSALLRPGRFDHVVYVGLPDFEDRLDILSKLCPLAGDDIRVLAERTDGLSTADLAGVVRTSTSTTLEAYTHSLLAHQHGRVKSSYSLSSWFITH